MACMFPPPRLAFSCPVPCETYSSRPLLARWDSPTWAKRLLRWSTRIALGSSLQVRCCNARLFKFCLPCSMLSYLLIGAHGLRYWLEMRHSFCVWLDNVLGPDFPDFDQQVSYVFEMVCRDRTTYTGKEHTELTVGYKDSGLFLLGALARNKHLKRRFRSFH